MIVGKTATVEDVAYCAARRCVDNLMSTLVVSSYRTVGVLPRPLARHALRHDKKTI